MAFRKMFDFMLWTGNLPKYVILKILLNTLIF